MGTITIKDATNVDVTIYAVRRYSPTEILDRIAHIKNGGMSIQETQPAISPPTQSFIGEISANIHNVHKMMCLCESQKLVMKVIYTLPDPNIGIPKFQGLGHVVFRYPGRCTSVQVSLDDLTINQTTATATYSGFFEKCF